MKYPFRQFKTSVSEDWIDINGHMNAIYYGQVIYDAHYLFTEHIGLGEAYVNATQCGKAVLESHCIYEREMEAGDDIEVVSWLLAVDRKRLHFFHELYAVNKGFRAAVGEQVDIHIDLKRRCSAALPEEIYDRLYSIVASCHENKLPDKIGSTLRPPRMVLDASKES